jgi:hypothetical protein
VITKADIKKAVAGMVQTSRFTIDEIEGEGDEVVADVTVRGSWSASYRLCKRPLMGGVPSVRISCCTGDRM